MEQVSQVVQQHKAPLVILAGPTAVGKSDAAVDLALRLDGSVISADSMQVYRGMNIGTAKLRPEEMRGVPHYLIDVAEPDEEWNVVRFQAQARQAAAEILAKGRLPILVGGTGFYIQSLLYDIDFTQTAEDSAYRKELEELARTQGPEALHRLLEEADPESAAAIHPHNIKRVIRALEYAQDTGETISSHNETQRRRPPAWDAVFLCLTMDRQKLYARIDARVDRMLSEGLVEEVRALRSRGFSASDVSMQGLGYRQLLPYLDGKCTLEEAASQIRIQTRHFAKRQLTWFRRERGVTWIDADAWPSRAAMIDAMEEMVRQHYHSPAGGSAGGNRE